MVVGGRGEGGFLLWSELSPESLARLEASADEPATLQALADLLSTADMDDPLKRAVMLELHLNSLYFARKQGFSSEKTSALFSIIKRNHDEMAEAFLPPHKSWDYFKVLPTFCASHCLWSLMLLCPLDGVCSRRLFCSLTPSSAPLIPSASSRGEKQT